jgi:signal transduction histidine kinase
MKGNESNAMVFVVDDDPAMRGSIEDLVRSAGLHVKAFASAEAFLKTIERGSARSGRRSCKSDNHATDSGSGVGDKDLPACLVLDVQLRGISGLDLQQRMAESRIEIPIIFITGHGDIRTSVCAMKAGAVEFLTKPFPGEDLIEAVRSTIERHRAARQLSMSMKVDVPTYSQTRDEINRLAGEIHDGLAQHLSAIYLQLKAAKDVLASAGGDCRCNLERAIEVANQGLIETRRGVCNLRSSVDQELPLRMELQQLAERWQVGGRWHCQFQSDPIPENKISARAKHQLVRIAQEAVHNAARHANPTLILMTLLWRGPNVILQVTDNGKGITAGPLQKSEGFGLRNMQKRAEDLDGTFKVRSAVGRGTSITVTVPIS